MKKTKGAKDKKMAEGVLNKKDTAKAVSASPDVLSGYTGMTRVNMTSFDLYIPDDRIGLL